MQKRFQVVETEGTSNRDGLCCVSCPKLTVWVAANSSKDCTNVKNYQYRSKPGNVYALRQSANCLGLRQRICFKKREPWIERTRGERKQEVNPLTFHITLSHALEDRMCPGCRMVYGKEGSVR